MNVDMILYNHFPNDVRPRKEAEALESDGHSVRVFCLGLPDEKPTESYSHSIQVIRVLDATPQKRVNPILMIVFWIRVLITWERVANSTALHCHDLSGLPPGFILSIVYRIHLVYDSHELFPEAAGRRYGMVAYSLFFALETICCLAISSLIGVSAAQIEILKHRCRCSAIYLNNYPNLSELNYSFHEMSGETVIFGMSGYLFSTRGHAEVMDALELLTREGVKLEFWIIGDGPEMENLKDKADALSFPTKFSGYVDDLQEMWDVISRFDYAIIANHPSKNYLVTSTNRSYEYAALGVPFICPHYKGISDILVALNLPDFSPLRPESIRTAIEKLMKRSRRELSVQGRELIESRFNWKKTSRKLLELYKKLDESV